MVNTSLRHTLWVIISFAIVSGVLFILDLIDLIPSFAGTTVVVYVLAFIILSLVVYFSDKMLKSKSRR